MKLSRAALLLSLGVLACWASPAGASVDLVAASVNLEYSAGQWWAAGTVEINVSSVPDEFTASWQLQRTRSGSTVVVGSGDDGVGSGIGSLDCPSSPPCNNTCTYYIKGVAKSGTCNAPCPNCRLAVGRAVTIDTPVAGDVYTLVLSCSITETSTTNNTASVTY